MNENILMQAKQHAADEFPKESVGFVVQQGRKTIYIRAQNIHPEPLENFAVGIDDLKAARESGEVIRVIHSHPNCAGAIATPSDRAGMIECDIPYGILNWPFSEYNEFFPEEALPLLGRPFHLGTSDCYGLVMDWFKLQEIILPDFRLDYPWWEVPNGPNLYVDNLDVAGFDRVTDIQPGDMVVFTIMADRPNHAGIMMPNGEILHHLYGQLSCRDFYGDFFRQRTTFIARHRALKEVKQWL